MKSKHAGIALILIFVVALAIVWLMKASILSAYFTDKMNVPVSFHSIRLRPSSTTIRHFRILNPVGFAERTALDIEIATIDYRLRKLFSTPSEIDQIVLDGVHLYIEVPRTTEDNNWAALGSQIAEKRQNDKPVLVHQLILRNLTVETRGKGAESLGIAGVRKFDQMQFAEINSAQGFPTEELIQKVFRNAGIEAYIKNLLNPARQIKKALSPLKKLFGS